jgi:hypothetical protein
MLYSTLTIHFHLLSFFFSLDFIVSSAVSDYTFFCKEFQPKMFKKNKEHWLAYVHHLILIHSYKSADVFILVVTCVLAREDRMNKERSSVDSQAFS